VMGNPWLFAETRARLDGKAYTPPTTRERIETAVRQLDTNVREKGERMGVLQARGQLSWYLKGIRGAAEARAAMNGAVTRDEMVKILRSVV